MLYKKTLGLDRGENNEIQMLHFNSELGKCQLVLSSESSPVGVITHCPFDIEKTWKLIN